MSRRKVSFKIFESVRIESAVSEGNCIAFVEGKALFVKYAAPGDLVDVQIVKKKKNYLEGRIIKFHEKSPLRQQAFCSHFEICGGCKWQHLPYEHQLEFKQKQVTDALERIGGVQGFEVKPILGSKLTRNYRNKLDLTFSNRGWLVDFTPGETKNPTALGFHIPGRFDKVLDVTACHLMPDGVNLMQRSIKEFCDANHYEYYDLIAQEGLMRNVLFRCNSQGDWMVLVSFFYQDDAKIAALMNHLSAAFPKITSLLYVINDKKNDTLNDLEVLTWKGDAFLLEKLGGLTFRIQPQSFFQTNTAQAEVLYSITREMAGLTGKELVYDLYTGAGSIALYVAAHAKHVVGVEYVEEAVVDARDNMARNNISNAEFYAGDMKDILTAEFVEQHGKPDVIITDPPRDGMHPSVVQRLLEMEAPRIVYVSCNPSTQARDAKLLAEKYELAVIQSVDMFPHTHHVENVGLWLLKNQ